METSNKHWASHSRNKYGFCNNISVQKMLYTILGNFDIDFVRESRIEWLFHFLDGNQCTLFMDILILIL